MRSFASLTLLTWLATTAARAEPIPAETFEHAAARRGQEVLRSLQADIDGDGREEIVAAVLVEQGAAVAVWQKPAEGPYQLLFTGRVYDGEVVLQLQARQLVGDPKPEVIFEVREVSPDETVRRLVIFRWVDGGLVPVFDTPFSVDDLRPGRPGETTVAFGETAAGYRFVDEDGDGNLELAVRRDVKVVRALRPDRSTLRVVVGAQETLYRYQPGVGRRGEYVAGRERFFPYVHELGAAAVTASSQQLPAELENAYGRAAVEKGVKNVFTGLHDAEDGGSGDGAGLSLERDPAPRADWASDNDLDSAWCEGQDGDGQGEWWQVSFDRPRSLQMARLMLGDLRSAKDFAASNKVSGVVLLFSSGDKIYFDPDDPAFSGGPLAGFHKYPLGEGRPGEQTLIFFSKPIMASWVRVEFGAVRKRGRGNRSCITEAKFYGLQEDASPAAP